MQKCITVLVIVTFGFLANNVLAEGNDAELAAEQIGQAKFANITDEQHRGMLQQRTQMTEEQRQAIREQRYNMTDGQRLSLQQRRASRAKEQRQIRKQEHRAAQQDAMRQGQRREAFSGHGGRGGR